MRLVVVTLVLVVVLLACADTTSPALTEREAGVSQRSQGRLKPVRLASRSVSARHLSPRALWRAFLCIHRHEATWTDRGAPYYGGLQMDAEFEKTYGPEFVRMWKHSSNWPPAVQMTVAMRAYEKRGFGPWPATSRRCGLR